MVGKAMLDGRLWPPHFNHEDPDTAIPAGKDDQWGESDNRVILLLRWAIILFNLGVHGATLFPGRDGEAVVIQFKRLLETPSEAYDKHGKEVLKLFLNSGNQELFWVVGYNAFS